jgi:hypothetical protein
MVFCSTNLRTYYGIDMNTSDTVWTFTDPYASEFIVSSPIYVNGQLFIVDKFNIACLNANNGSTIWSFFSGDELTISPSYADGKIYVVTSQRHIFILDANDNGTKIATATTPSSSWSSPTIANGRLYIGCNDWNIYCFANPINNEVTPPPNNGGGGPSVTVWIAAVAGIITVAVVVIVAIVYVMRKKNQK